MAALAELALTSSSLIYRGKANVPLAPAIFLAAHKDEPISGICLLLPLVFNDRQGCGFKSI